MSRIRYGILRAGAANTDLEPLNGGLLAGYLGRPAPLRRARLQRLSWLYDYVCLLWSELYCGATDGGRPQAQRGRVLRRG